MKVIPFKRTVHCSLDKTTVLVNCEMSPSRICWPAACTCLRQGTFHIPQHCRTHSISRNNTVNYACFGSLVACFKRKKISLLSHCTVKWCMHSMNWSDPRWLKRTVSFVLHCERRLGVGTIWTIVYWWLKMRLYQLKEYILIGIFQGEIYIWWRCESIVIRNWHMSV